MTDFPFTLGDIKKQNIPEQINESTKKQDVLVQRMMGRHFMAIDNIRDLTGRMPVADEIFVLWSLKSFNTFSFIQYIISEKNRIDELHITTYNISRIVIQSLMQLIDAGSVGNLYLFVSDVAKALFPRSFIMLQEESSARPELVHVKYSWNHSKIALAQCRDDYYVIEGSGNFSENARHEQYIFTNNKEWYGFRKNWISTELD